MRRSQDPPSATTHVRPTAQYSSEQPMPLSDLHASHIGRVNVAFVISSTELDPEMITSILRVKADRCARRSDERRNAKGEIIGAEERGWYRIDSAPLLSGRGRIEKDVNEHFRALLEIVLPHKEALTGTIPQAEIYFDVLWESSYLYAGTGPLFDADVIRGIASLGAAMGFDIYDIREDTS